MASELEIAGSKCLDLFKKRFLYENCFRRTFVEFLGPDPTENEKNTAVEEANLMLAIDPYYRGLLEECEILYSNYHALSQS